MRSIAINIIYFFIPLHILYNTFNILLLLYKINNIILLIYNINSYLILHTIIGYEFYRNTYYIKIVNQFNISYSVFNRSLFSYNMFNGLLLLYIASYKTIQHNT